MMNKLTWPRIEALLQTAGGLEEQAKIAGRELNDCEREFVARARSSSRELGLNSRRLVLIEREGASIVRRAWERGRALRG